jgi:hypothetical protein
MSIYKYKRVIAKNSLKYLYKKYNILLEKSQQIEQTILKVIERNCKRIFAFSSNEVKNRSC